MSDMNFRIPRKPSEKKIAEFWEFVRCSQEREPSPPSPYTPKPGGGEPTSEATILSKSVNRNKTSPSLKDTLGVQPAIGIWKGFRDSTCFSNLSGQRRPVD